MAGVPPSAFKYLLETGEHSDFIVVCGGTEFKVHKAIITPASEYFKVMCRDEFKENNEGRVELKDYEPGTVARMLEYLYTGTSTAETSSMAFETESTSLSKADSILIDLSLEEVRSQLIADLKTHALVYQLSDMLGIDDLRPGAYIRFKARYYGVLVHHEDFVDLLTVIFTTTSPTDQDLRSFVMKQFIAQHHEIEGIGPLVAVLESYEPMVWLIGVALQREVEVLEKSTGSLSKAASTDLRRALEALRSRW